MGGLEGPPKPPALGNAPAQPGRSSISPCALAASKGPRQPPAHGRAPAQPGRSSMLLRGLAASKGPPTSRSRHGPSHRLGFEAMSPSKLEDRFQTLHEIVRAARLSL